MFFIEVETKITIFILDSPTKKVCRASCWEYEEKIKQDEKPIVQKMKKNTIGISSELLKIYF